MAFDLPMNRECKLYRHRRYNYDGQEKNPMFYEPPPEPNERNDKIDSLCMEIAELVGMLTPEAPLAKSPTLHRELRVKRSIPRFSLKEATLTSRLSRR